jgi:hypothetical protein
MMGGGPAPPGEEEYGVLGKKGGGRGEGREGGGRGEGGGAGVDIDLSEKCLNGWMDLPKILTPLRAVENTNFMNCHV